MKKIVALLCCCFAATAQGQTASALQADPAGWTDLLRDKSLKHWVRTPMAQSRSGLRAGSLNDPSPWKLDTARNLLTGDGAGTGHGHEYFRYDKPVKNFILHAEYRFVPVAGEAKYNAGILFRASADAKVWHQGQATQAGGFLVMNTLVDGMPRDLNRSGAMKQNRVNPVGEWNIYEIRADKRTISLWVNGDVVDEFHEAEVLDGYVGLEVEGYRVEYRNILLKQLP